MAHVFISYDRRDAREAQRVRECLEAHAFQVWMDVEGIHGQVAFARQIEQALESAFAVVVLWSRHSVESDWVRSEAERGRQDGKLHQVRVDDVNLPTPFSALAYSDLGTDVERLVSSLGRQLPRRLGGTDRRRLGATLSLAFLALLFLGLWLTGAGDVASDEPRDLRRRLQETEEQLEAAKAEIARLSRQQDEDPLPAPPAEEDFERALAGLSVAARNALDCLSKPGTWRPEYKDPHGFVADEKYGDGVPQAHSLGAIHNAGALDQSRTGAIRLFEILAHPERCSWRSGTLQVGGAYGWWKCRERDVHKRIADDEAAAQTIAIVQELQRFLLDWGEQVVAQEILAE